MKHYFKIVIIFLVSTISILTTGCKITAEKRAEALNNFALMCADKDVWKEAEYRLRQAIELKPEDARLHNNLGIVLEAQGKLKEALNEYKKALSIEPDNKIIKRNLKEFINAHKIEVDN